MGSITPMPDGLSEQEGRQTTVDTGTIITNHLTCESNAETGEYVLVTGGLGYIGSHTVWLLLKAGESNVIIVDNLSNSTIKVLQSLRKLRDTLYGDSPDKPLIDFYQTNYCDQEQMRTILSRYQWRSATNAEQGLSSVRPRSRITGIIHFAALKAVAESFEKPLEYYANNVGGMIDFCRILTEFNITTFIFSSSATVYGEAGDHDGRLVEERCESDSCNKLLNPYGRTKWMSEAILADVTASNSSWTAVALRYFNPIGCDESGLLGEEPSGTPTNLMPLIVKAMTNDRASLHIFGTDWETRDGTTVRDYIHVSDLAEGHITALDAIAQKRLGPGFHVLNLGTGTGHSVRELVAVMEESSGKTIPVLEEGRRQGDLHSCVADASRAESVLGWTARRSIADACDDICHRLDMPVT